MGVRYILWRIVGLQGSYSGLVAAGAIDIDLIFYDVCAMGHEVEVEVVCGIGGLTVIERRAVVAELR